MRVPWLQVGSDVVSAKAGDLAVLLKCSRREAIGLLVDLWAWVLSRSPDDAPPDGIVRDSRTGTGAVPQLERAVSWDGPEGMLVTALEELGFIELVPGGLRFRGIKRYAATWEKNRRRKPAAPKPERNRTGTGDEAARKTQTQTHTHIEDPPPTSSFAHPTASVAPIHLNEEDEEKGDEHPQHGWPLTRAGFWNFSRAIRAKVLPGAHREERRPKGFAEWWARAVREAGDRTRIFCAFEQYLQDEDFRERGCPMPLFMADAVWRQRLADQSPPPRRSAAGFW